MLYWDIGQILLVYWVDFILGYKGKNYYKNISTQIMCRICVTGGYLHISFLITSGKNTGQNILYPHMLWSWTRYLKTPLHPGVWMGTSLPQVRFFNVGWSLHWVYYLPNFPLLHSHMLSFCIHIWQLQLNYCFHHTCQNSEHLNYYAENNSLILIEWTFICLIHVHVWLKIKLYWERYRT